jgi:NAD(P)-dependent dehydrogenase (short-subunit alcohol dehydrogenase family)
MRWTINNIPDQSGRIAVVTGANSGLGFQTALVLAIKRATVIMACRNTGEGRKAADQIKTEYPEAKVSVMKLDLADLDSVAEFAKSYQDKHDKLDLLINNAGVMIPPFSRTRQGFELQFGTNHLGHFALTGRLLPLLINTYGSRVISVSSLAAKFGKIDFEDLNYERKPYKPWYAYGQSKLADLIFIMELSRRLRSNGLNTIAAAAHPGGSPTNLQRTSSFFMKYILTPLISQKPADAALPTLRAACDPHIENGSFWGPSGFFELSGHPVKTAIQKSAKDPKVAKELWEASEKLTGVKYSFVPSLDLK